MKKPVVIILSFACAFALIMGYAVNRYILGGPRSPLMGFCSEIQENYESIKVGYTIEQVIDRLGPPKRTGTSLLLPQKRGFEEYFRQADASNAEIYYLWMNGGNWFYSIGFDATSKVVIKAEGHS